MPLMIDQIQFREMFDEPTRRPTPAEIASAKWLVRQITKHATRREGTFPVLQQIYDIYTKKAVVVAEQNGRQRTFGHAYLSPDERQTFDGPHVPEWAR